MSWEAFSSDHKAEKHLKGSLCPRFYVRVTMAVLGVISKIDAFAVQATWIAEFHIQANLTCGNHNWICGPGPVKPKLNQFTQWLVRVLHFNPT
jgi:hypothetical protein